MSNAAYKSWEWEMRTIGSGLLWLPSRRLVSSQRGAFVMDFEGHCRSGRLRGGKGLYFFHGSLSLVAGRVRGQSSAA